MHALAGSRMCLFVELCHSHVVCPRLRRCRDDDGLARFDGREFTVYDAARFRDMGGNRVRAVYADGFGEIYALGALGEWLRVQSDAVTRAALSTE